MSLSVSLLKKNDQENKNERGEKAQIYNDP